MTNVGSFHNWTKAFSTFRPRQNTKSNSAKSKKKCKIFKPRDRGVIEDDRVLRFYEDNCPVKYLNEKCIDSKLPGCNWSDDVQHFCPQSNPCAKSINGKCCHLSRNLRISPSSESCSVNYDNPASRYVRITSQERIKSGLVSRYVQVSLQASPCLTKPCSSSLYLPPSTSKPLQNPQSCFCSSTVTSRFPCTKEPCTTSSRCSCSCQIHSSAFCLSPLQSASSCQKQPMPSRREFFSDTMQCCPCGGCNSRTDIENFVDNQFSENCDINEEAQYQCRCKCQSGKGFHPGGGCGGQSCGRIYSCAGSGGGTCCFPRNTKRRFGSQCCSSGNRNCNSYC